MEYNYKKPSVMNFQSFSEEFIPAFDQIEEAAKQKALSLNVWAYTVCNPLTVGPAPWGGIYELPNPNCIPT